LESHSHLGILAYFNAYALAQGTRGQLLQAIPMKLCRGQTYGNATQWICTWMCVFVTIKGVAKWKYFVEGMITFQIMW